MYYILVHYPKIDATKIENFRRKYDLTFEVIRAHITIVFPYQDVETEEKIKHIKKKNFGTSIDDRIWTLDKNKKLDLKIPKNAEKLFVDFQEIND